MPRDVVKRDSDGKVIDVVKQEAEHADLSINAKVTTKKQLTIKIDYNGGTNPVYIGFASSGTATSASSWRIMKLTYDVNSNVTDVQWAGGTTDFSNIYDNRASLSYS